MKTKYFYSLIGIGLLCIAVMILLPHSEAAITFSGNTIRVRGCDYIDNLTDAIYAKEITTTRDVTDMYADTSYLPQTPADGEFMYIYPMDTGNFNSSQIWINVYDTDSTNAVIKICVTWSNGTKGTTSTTITGNGIYKFLTGSQTIHNANTSYCTSITTGTYVSWKIIQFRAGVFGRYDDRHIFFNGVGLAIGQSIKSVRVKFTNMNINFNSTDWIGAYYPFSMAGSTSSLDFINCSVTIDDRLQALTMNAFITGTYKYFNASCSYFKSFGKNRLMGSSATTCFLNLKDCLFVGMGIDSYNVSINNVMFKSYYSYCVYNIKVRLLTDVSIQKGTYSLAFASNNYNISNSVFNGNAYLFAGVGVSGPNYIIDCITDNYNCYTGGSFAGGKVHWAYTFNLRVKNETTSEQNLSGVGVIIYNKANVIKYTGTTDINGQIPKIVLTERWWDITNFVIGPYIENPYKIVLSKTGFETQTITLFINSPQNLTINLDELEEPSTVVLIENIGGTTTGTHEKQWDGFQWNVWANYTSGGGSCPVLPFIILHNPNPANGTTLLNTNFISYNPDGLGLFIDINYTLWPDNLNIYWWIYNSTMDLIDADTSEDVSHNGTFGIYSSLTGTENDTYYWYVEIWSTSSESIIYTTKMFTFTTGFQSDNFLYIAGLSLNPEMFLFMIWTFFLWLWFKAESWEITALLAVILAPYSVIIGFYMMPIFLVGVSAELLTAMQMLPIVVSVIIVGFTIDVYRKRHKK